MRLVVPLYVYSVTGDSICYSYDDWGRPFTVRAPQESDTTWYPTIQYCYWDGAQPAVQFIMPGFRSVTALSALTGHVAVPVCSNYDGGPLWAQTLHHSRKDSVLDVATVVFVDGHGRVLQTRKTAVIDGQYNQVFSGQVIYDNAGRPIKQYEPVEMPNDMLCNYVQHASAGMYTITEYDLLDRVVKKEIPAENIVTINQYGFVPVEGVNLFSTKITDPEYNTTETLTDVRGLTIRSTDAMGGVTWFKYDALGQLLRSCDPDTFETQYIYDMQGHLVRRVHPDAGITQYEYDPAGHLTRETNPLGNITYRYSYDRLQHK